MTRMAAVILAAGEGKRLGGVAKAALKLDDGRTFLQAIVAAAKAAGCGRIVVVAGEPHLEETRAAAAGLADEVVVNDDPSKGMSSSVAVGVKALDAGQWDAALLWPVDHAFVKDETVTAIVQAATRETIVIPTYLGRGGHPTAFGADTWQELVESVDQGGARHVIRRVPSRMHRVALVDPGLLQDYDEEGGGEKEGE